MRSSAHAAIWLSCPSRRREQRGGECVAGRRECRVAWKATVPVGAAPSPPMRERREGRPRSGGRLLLVRSSEVRLGADSCLPRGKHAPRRAARPRAGVGAAASRRTPWSRAARGAPHALRQRGRVSRAARALRLRRCRGGRGGGSRVLGAARPRRGRWRRRRVRPGAGAAGLRGGR